MPLYEYRCKQCGHQFEKIQSFSAPDETECLVCKGELERLISAPAVQFKGSGWYVTDYAKGGAKSPTKSAESNGSGDKSATASSSDGSSSTSTPAANSSSATTKSE